MASADQPSGAETPQAHSGTPKKLQDLRKIAWYQRAVNLAILAAITSVGLAVSGVAPRSVTDIAMTASSAVALVTTVLLANALHGTLWAVLCVLLMFVPYLNVLVLFVLSSQATKRAREAGLKVGLLGVSSRDLRALGPDASKKTGWSVWVLLAVALVLLVAVRTYRVFKTPSGSMIPTLFAGDLIVTQSSSSAPRRGDVLVFRFPENRDQLFIKRVIALPGDVLEVINGRPVINGWLVPHCHVGVYHHEYGTAELYVEYLGDAAYGTIYDTDPDDRACKAGDDCGPGLECHAGLCGTLQGPFNVTDGQAWVMGDNRNNSHDSRSWRGGLGGGVPFADFIASGRVILMGSDKGGDGRSFASVQGPPMLSSNWASLKPALDKCLRERPPVDKTTPPPRSREAQSR